MSIPRATPVHELLAKIIFLILPTAALGYFLLYNANTYFAILSNDTWRQALYFGAGMVGSALFYSLRFRFVPTAAILGVVLYTLYKGIDAAAFGEFDAFFASIQFLIFAMLFSVGWLVGWGFLRLRYWSIGVAGAALVSCILLIAKTKLDTVDGLLSRFLPALLYSVYLVFAAEQIYNYRDKSQRYWWFLSRRVVGFGVLALLILGGVVFFMGGRIEETVANYGGGGKAGENSMLKGNKDGTFDLKNYTKLQSSLGRNNELLFAARINNFFPGTETPNPLYLTAFYYTKFDTATETFTRDSLIPDNDLFEPQVASIPLFGTRTDTSVLRPGLNDEYQSVVEIEVYNKKLNPNTYLAPHVGYFVQPITVDKDYRDQFRTAFRAKSLVSELNSAYFIYNADDKEIKKFQEQRFTVLRRAKNYTGVDPRFMAYYTYMPRDPKWSRISTLTQQVTAGKTLPVDKVLAIRDWFLSKDPAGQPLFKYTDNPGIPDLPSASKLMYFLFENRKGYCAYYAGATLFMLRSLGIPSRIAVGFLTVDRSGGKNPGWYWYYADQAHAWVQVYFPGFGWLDFDTTVGNSDARESPQPDGTPPAQPPRSYLAATGVITGVDTAAKTITMDIGGSVFKDVEYSFRPPLTVTMDVHVAAFKKDSADVPLASVRPGDSATAVSYAEVFKNFPVKASEKGESIVSRWPKPAPIDEVYLKRKDTLTKEQKQEIAKADAPFNWQRAALVTGGMLGGLALLYMLLPTLLFAGLRSRYRAAKSSTQKAYWAYRTSSFYLHQLGVFRGNLTPMQYATRVVDPQFGTAYTPFMNAYLKTKYAGAELNERESSAVTSLLPEFFGRVRAKIPAGRRIADFLRPWRALRFLSAPEGGDQRQS